MSARPDPRTSDPGWWFPEDRPVGVDLATPASVAAYDVRQGTDPAADDALTDRLGVGWTSRTTVAPSTW